MKQYVRRLELVNQQLYDQKSTEKKKKTNCILRLGPRPSALGLRPSAFGLGRVIN